MTCKWKGNIRNGHVLCGSNHKEVTITTDNFLVTCIQCLRLLKHKISYISHIHLNNNFLNYAKYYKDEGLIFEKYVSDKVDTICPTKNSGNLRVTNDPKEITCSHCLRLVWGGKNSMQFILTGLMVECGHTLSVVRRKTSTLSAEKLKKKLNSLLYNSKV